MHRICTPLEVRENNPVYIADDATICDVLQKVAGKNDVGVKIYWSEPLKGGKYENNLTQVFSLNIDIAPEGANFAEKEIHKCRIILG